MRLGLGLGLAYRRRNRLFLLGEAAPTFVSAAHSADSSGTSKTVTISGTAGQLFLGLASLQDSGRDINAIANWDDFFGGSVGHAGNANHEIRVMRRLLAGAVSDPALTITGAGTDEWGWSVALFSGLNASTPINASDIAASSSDSRSPVCPTITTTVANCLIVRAFIGRTIPTLADTGYPTNTTGAFVRLVLGAENAQTIGLAYVVQAAAGATGTATFTNALNANGRWHGITIALAPVES